MKYFDYFPQTKYDFDVNGTNVTFDITIPTTRLKMMQRLQQAITVFYDYVVEDGQRPDTVSTMLYGSPNYTWVILLINNIQSLFDWPLSSAEFQRFIVDKYGSLQLAQSEWLYYTVDGYQVDVRTYTALDVSLRGTPKNNYDWEIELNEAKRRIKVIPTEFAAPLALELQKVFV